MATAAFMPIRDCWEQCATLVRREGAQAIVNATKERWFTEGLRKEAPGSVQSVAAIVSGIDPDSYAGACEGIARVDLRPLFPAIMARNLIILGHDDPATPLPMAEDLAACISGSGLAFLSPAAYPLTVGRLHGLQTCCGGHRPLPTTRCSRGLRVHSSSGSSPKPEDVRGLTSVDRQTRNGARHPCREAFTFRAHPALA